MKNSLKVPLVFFLKLFLWMLYFCMLASAKHYAAYKEGGINDAYGQLIMLYAISMPASCMIAVISVFRFLMCCRSKILFSYLFLAVSFAVCFFVLIPAGYSHAEKKGSALYIEKISIAQDKDLTTFIKEPFIVKHLKLQAYLLLYDMFEHYKKGYFSYLLFSGAIFFLIFSSFGLSYITEWKILNAVYFTIFLYLVFFLYSLTKTTGYRILLNYIIPIHIEEEIKTTLCLFILGCSIFLLSFIFAKKYNKNTYKFSHKKLISKR